MLFALWMEPYLKLLYDTTRDFGAWDLIAFSGTFWALILNMASVLYPWLLRYDSLTCTYHLSYDRYHVILCIICIISVPELLKRNYCKITWLGVEHEAPKKMFFCLFPSVFVISVTVQNINLESWYKREKDLSTVQWCSFEMADGDVHSPWSDLVNMLQTSTVSALSLVLVCSIVLWLQLPPTPSLSLCLSSLFSPPSSDSDGLSECSCDSVALRQKGGCTVNARKREKKEIASRLPRHQKRDTFFISYLAYEKKKKKNARRR